MSREPFDAVVSTHGPAVLRVCRAVLGPHAADDAWSETFLAALRAYPRLRPGSDVRAWLVTIAHRKAIDHVRAEHRRARPTDPADLADVARTGTAPAGTAASVTSTVAADAVAAVDDRLDADGLWAALRALPFKQRATVAYHHVMGLPHAEVAAIVGGSEAAARRAAADGIAALRRALGRAPDGSAGRELARSTGTTEEGR